MKSTHKFTICVLLLISGTARGQAPDVSGAAKAMAALIADFREGMTLAEWRKAHRDDSVGPFQVSEQDAHAGADTDWCARSSKTLRLPDGRAIERAAYFFAPERRPGQSLPAGDSDPDLISTCTLGHLWVETAEPNVETGAGFAQMLRAALQDRFGTPDAKSEISFLGSAAWEQKSRWKHGNTMIAAAYDKTIGGHGPKRVLAFVTSVVADKYGFNFGVVKGFESDYTPIRELLRRAERLGGLEEEAADLERFLDATNPNRPGAPQDPCADGVELASALARWMQTAKPWQGERRAAALLVADLTTAASERCFSGEEQESTRTRLKALGAELQFSELGGAWVYTRNWLRQAVQEEPAGRIGEMAFREWMRIGFREGCCCIGESPEGVIEKGEQYLKQKRSPETEALVHFMVGDAYRDIVALASGAGQEYGDPETYSPKAPRARQQAIAHYRAGLKLDSQSQAAQKAWVSAWRLLASLTTGETRYFCVYD